MKLFKGKAMKTVLTAAALAITPNCRKRCYGDACCNDFVGISFWTISMALMAAAFFFIGSGRVEGKWKTAMTIVRTRADRCSGALLLHA